MDNILKNICINLPGYFQKLEAKICGIIIDETGKEVNRQNLDWNFSRCYNLTLFECFTGKRRLQGKVELNET